MGMQISGHDVAERLNKSSMVGYQQQVRTDLTVHETDKAEASEQARDADAEHIGGDASGLVGSSSGVRRSTPLRREGQEARQSSRLGRDLTEWQDDRDRNPADPWLPPALQPRSQTAGTASNIPWWLQVQRWEQPPSETPAAAHRKLLKGLKAMVSHDIAQYIKANDPPYTKQTLRDIYSVLEDDGGDGLPAPPRLAEHNDAAEPAGLTFTNWRRAWSCLTLLEATPPPVGQLFDMVA